MTARPSPPPEARRILSLAHRDKPSAEQQLSELSLEDQVALICETPVEQRAALLLLTPTPENVIPLLPVAELCFTVKAIGLADASWILRHATAEQIQASFDLDAWTGITPDRVALGDWFASLAEAGDETLIRTAQALDPELIVLYLRDRVDVVLKPNEEGWDPPVGAQTLEGQFYLTAKRENDDLAPLLALLHTLFNKDYWLYFRMMQGVSWELESGLEEWALRWRTGRLEDLGFPSWDEAMRIYGYLRPDKRRQIPTGAQPLDVTRWKLPVWMPELPAARDARYSVFRAAADLAEDERSAFFYAFVGIANKLAVADRMPLGEPETLPEAIEKVAQTVSVGLEFVAAENGLGMDEVLRRATLEHLFRVGASLDPDLGSAGAKR